jgi:hypothetical protein
MKILTTLFIIAVNSTSLIGQQMIFRSDSAHANDYHVVAFSSFYVNGDLVLFNAEDYFLYAYHRKTGKKLWGHYVGYKGKISPFLYDGNVVAKGSYFMTAWGIQNGEEIERLPMSGLSTTPMVKGTMMYATGSYQDQYHFYAYDFAAKKVRWHMPVGIGFATRPYYQKNHVYVNIDFGEWIKVDYEGRFQSCNSIPVSDSKTYPTDCKAYFELISHDGLKLSREQAARLFGGQYHTVREVKYFGSRTVAVEKDGTRIIVLGNKLKPVAVINLFDYTKEKIAYEDETSIIGLKQNRLWILYNYNVYTYDLDKKQLTKDEWLSAFEPSAMQLIDDEVWFISWKDKRLYGFKL